MRAPCQIGPASTLNNRSARRVEHFALPHETPEQATFWDGLGQAPPWQEDNRAFQDDNLFSARLYIATAGLRAPPTTLARRVLVSPCWMIIGNETTSPKSVNRSMDGAHNAVRLLFRVASSSALFARTLTVRQPLTDAAVSGRRAEESAGSLRCEAQFPRKEIS
jgi:hypothetical protein